MSWSRFGFTGFSHSMRRGYFPDAIAMDRREAPGLTPAARPLRYHPGRVELYVEPVHHPVQMRAGDAAGLADGADLLAAFHLLADLHIDPAHMQIGGLEAVPVIDEDHVAVEIHIRFRQHDFAVGGRYDGVSLGGRDIDPGMGVFRSAVEDALAAEDLSLIHI